MQRLLGVGAEEALAMPWWRWRMLVEGINEELAEAQPDSAPALDLAEVGADGSDQVRLADMGFQVT